MLINAIDEEESRMAIVENGKLVEFNIQLAVKEPITGNIYKGIVQKVEKGLQAAFVDFGAGKNGFLPFRDVNYEQLGQKEESEASGKSRSRPGLKPRQELFVQVVREGIQNKGAMLTNNLSLPGRYLVLMPNRKSAGISRKIEDEADRKRLKTLMDEITEKEGFGFIVRTAGTQRTKQEILRDYQMLIRMWKDIMKKAEKLAAPALVYRESDFAVRSLRDYYSSDIEEILVDHGDTYRNMRAYFKTVSPRNVKMIKHYKEEVPLFEKFNIEGQIEEVYRERVFLKSGGHLFIKPTEAMITIDVNSGKGTSRKDVEDTAYRTNLEAAEEIARQLRLRDLGGLVVIDFIDMEDRKHVAQIEKTFKNALSIDRSRIQLSKISRFGMLELTRQKKQSTIQEISHVQCPHCKGTGIRPSLESLALRIYRKIKGESVSGTCATIKALLPPEVSDYLLNQKRSELAKLETLYQTGIQIRGSYNVPWGDFELEIVRKEPEGLPEPPPEAEQAAEKKAAPRKEKEREREKEKEKEKEKEPEKGGEGEPEGKKKSRSRRRRRRGKKKPPAAVEGTAVPESIEGAGTAPLAAVEGGEAPEPSPWEAPEGPEGTEPMSLTFTESPEEAPSEIREAPAEAPEIREEAAPSPEGREKPEEPPESPRAGESPEESKEDPEPGIPAE
jgi:ribonuclease E